MLFFGHYPNLLQLLINMLIHLYGMAKGTIKYKFIVFI